MSGFRLAESRVLLCPILVDPSTQHSRSRKRKAGDRQCRAGARARARVLQLLSAAMRARLTVEKGTDRGGRSRHAGSVLPTISHVR